MTDESASGRPRPRRRMLDAALVLAAEGGYDALQVRAIAERAGVSSRTIYANFSSLDALIIVAVAEQSEALYDQYTRRPPTGRTASARVQRLIDELSSTMTSNRQITSALMRALLSGKPDVTPYIRAFREALESVLIAAIAPEGATGTEREVVRILEGVWFSTLIGWVTGIDTADDVRHLMSATARRVIPEG